MVSGKVTTYQCSDMMDEDNTIQLILGARRSERKPPVFTPRSRSMEDLPGGIRVPIVKKTEPRLKTKLQATKAGLEELNLLRERHQRLVNDAKLTTTTKRSIDSSHGPDKMGRGPMKAFRRYSTNSSGMLSGISEENMSSVSSQASSRRTSCDHGSMTDSRGSLSHAYAKDIDAEINDVSSDIGANDNDSTLSRSFESTDSSTSGSHTSCSQSRSATPEVEEVNSAASAYLRRRMLTKSNSISIINTSKIGNSENINPNTAALPRPYEQPLTRRASVMCEAVLTSSKVNPSGIPESNASYNFPSPLHAVLRQYSSATKLDQTSIHRGDSLTHNLSQTTRSGFDRIDENSSLGMIAEEGRKLRALHAGLVNDTRPPLKSLQRRHSFSAHRKQFLQSSRQSLPINVAPVTQQADTAESLVKASSTVSTQRERPSSENVDHTGVEKEQFHSKTLSFNAAESEGMMTEGKQSEETMIGASDIGHTEKTLRHVAETQSSSLRVDKSASQERKDKIKSDINPQTRSETSGRSSSNLSVDSVSNGCAKTPKSSTSSDDDVFETVRETEVSVSSNCDNVGNDNCFKPGEETVSKSSVKNKEVEDNHESFDADVKQREVSHSGVRLSSTLEEGAVLKLSQEGPSKGHTEAEKMDSKGSSNNLSPQPSANQRAPIAPLSVNVVQVTRSESVSDIDIASPLERSESLNISSAALKDSKYNRYAKEVSAPLMNQLENTNNCDRRANNLSVDEGYSPSIISSKYSLVSDEGYGASIPSSKCSFASDESFPVFSPSGRRVNRKLSIQSDLTWISTDMDDTFSSVECFQFSPTGNRETDCFTIPSPTEVKPAVSIADDNHAKPKTRNLKPLLETAL